MYVHSSGGQGICLGLFAIQKEVENKRTKREILLLRFFRLSLLRIHLHHINYKVYILYIYTYILCGCRYIGRTYTPPQISENTPTCSSAFLCSEKPPAACSRTFQTEYYIFPKRNTIILY